MLKNIPYRYSGPDLVCGVYNAYRSTYDVFSGISTSNVCMYLGGTYDWLV